MVCKGGEVVLVGVPWAQKTDLPAFDLIDAIFHRYVILRSGWEWELPLYAEYPGQCNLLDQMQAAISWLHKKRIKVDNLYRICRPENIQDVYQGLLNRKWHELTAILDWRDR